MIASRRRTVKLASCRSPSGSSASCSAVVGARWSSSRSDPSHGAANGSGRGERSAQAEPNPRPDDDPTSSPGSGNAEHERLLRNGGRPQAPRGRSPRWRHASDAIQRETESRSGTSAGVTTTRRRRRTPLALVIQRVQQRSDPRHLVEQYARRDGIFQLASHDHYAADSRHDAQTPPVGEGR